jgi:hypothetical protein
VTSTGAAEAGAGARAARRQRAGAGWAAAVGAATRATAAEPVAWVVALAGFLARGGLVLVVLPIVVLPTLTGLATVLGPIVILVALSGPNASLIPLAAASTLAIAAWLVIGGLVGAVADIVLIRWFGRRLGGGGGGATPGLLDDGGWWGRTWRVYAVRLVAHVALLPVLAMAGTLVVSAVYRELTAPGDVTVPLVVRVILSVPGAIVAVTLVWLVGEAVGALAERRVVLQGRGAIGALASAVGSSIRSPLHVGATGLLATIGSVIAIVPAIGLLMAAWSATRTLVLGDLGLVALPAVVLLILAFGAVLVVAGLASAWRSALWTAEDLRQRHRLPAGADALPDGDSHGRHAPVLPDVDPRIKPDGLVHCRERRTGPTR